MSVLRVRGVVVEQKKNFVKPKSMHILHWPRIHCINGDSLFSAKFVVPCADKTLNGSFGSFNDRQLQPSWAQSEYITTINGTPRSTHFGADG